VFLVDAKVRTPPHTLRLTDISATVDQFTIPARNDWSSYELALSVPGKESTGSFAQREDKTGIAGHSVDGVAQGLDLNTVKPYIHKSGEADLSKGTLSMDMDCASIKEPAPPRKPS
jgi:hypothetical protein